jgi:subtilisin family serine protease
MFTHKFFTLGLLLISLHGKAQNNQYLLFLTNKGSVAVSEKNAASALSPLAINKHKQRGIVFSETDLPVNTAYLQAMQHQGLIIHFASRWLNMVHVSTALTATQLLQIFPFIQSVQPLQGESTNTRTDADVPLTTAGFGSTATQNNMLNLLCLHQNGYTGRGVLVAFFDIGFLGVDTIKAYDSARVQNRFISNRNFVSPEKNAFSNHYHGSLVFSTVGALWPNTFIGAAPGADYAFAVTEINNANDVHQEELNWLAAAEWADSLGVDIINSSLSYRTFEPGQGDYTDAQMDGKTAIITNAARWAAAKGIIVVNSAGNEGSFKATTINAPCDADSILCVGGVDANKQYFSMSSIGPTATGKIKPDVVAMGSNTAVISDAGYITFASGTSFSSPLIAGLAACLKQANPQRSSWEIIRAITVSGNHLNNPDNFYGYGVPDACRADSLLKTYTGIAPTPDELKKRVLVYPTIVTDYLSIELTDPSLDVGAFTVFDISGKKLKSTTLINEALQIVSLDGLLPGFYLVQIELNSLPVNFRIVKK